MSSTPIGYYRFLHGTKITVTVPEGVKAWRYGQRESLTMTVHHPWGSNYLVFEDYEFIETTWFDGQITVRLRIRVEWIVGRQRIPPDSEPNPDAVALE